MKHLLILACLLFSATQGFAIHTKAKQAIVIDANTGAVLFEKNPDQLMAPSSMTKMMTAYMVFREIEKGSLQFTDLLPVSKVAWKKGGSRMFIEVGTMVRVKDLLRGIITQSGNDASIAIAEGLSGNEAVFAFEMNRVAHELGATKTSFKNATGWPDPSHLSTARDLATLARALIHDFPQYYQEFFAEKEFTYNNIRQQNRNPLLFQHDIKADGVKTGHTSTGGYGLVGSAVDHSTRLIVVINGLKTKGERARESKSLLSWAFNNYLTPKLYSAGQTVIKAQTWLGDKPEVPLVVEQDVFVTIPKAQLKDIKVHLHYQEPINCQTMKAGDIVGHVEISGPKMESLSIPLKTAMTIPQAGFFKRISKAIHYLLFGHNA